jgi:ABC-type branched-subunit amino acid transport system substrate-binding protein
MRDKKTRKALAAATAVALLASLAACGGDDSGEGGDEGGGGEAAPGVTDTTVKIGTHHPLTGPAAAGYSEISPATKAYFEHVNEAGGVHGRTIEYIVKDDGYNPATTQDVVRELVLQDKVFAIVNGLGTPTHTGVLDFLKTNRVPDLFVASGSRSWNQPDTYPMTFGYNPDYTVEGKILATYVQENFADKTVCFFGQDDDLGADSLAGIEMILGQDGVAEKQSYVVTNQNVAPQVGALKDAGCEVVMLATVPGFTSLTIGTAARLGFQAQWVVTNIGGDYATLSAQLGDAAPLLEGLLSVNYQASHFSETDEWTNLFREINEKYNSGAPFNGNTVYGMMVGYMFVQALQRAGEDLTRESIIEAVEEGGFEGPGMVPTRFSSDDHSGYGGGQMTLVKGGTQEYFGPIYVTDDSDAPVEESDFERPSPPEDGIPTEE